MSAKQLKPGELPAGWRYMDDADGVEAGCRRPRLYLYQTDRGMKISGETALTETALRASERVATTIYPLGWRFA